MSEYSEVLRKDDQGGYLHRCPGCKGFHRIAVEKAQPNGAQWTFDGNMGKPTFSPSVKVTWKWGEEQRDECCHYFIRAGNIEFCADSTHDLAGKSVPLPPFDAGGD